MYFSASLVFPRVVELYSDGIIFYYLRVSTYVYIYLCVRSHVAIEIFYLWIHLHYLRTCIRSHALTEKNKF